MHKKRHTQIFSFTRRRPDAQGALLAPPGDMSSFPWRTLGPRVPSAALVVCVVVKFGLVWFRFIWLGLGNDWWFLVCLLGGSRAGDPPLNPKLRPPLALLSPQNSIQNWCGWLCDAGTFRTLFPSLTQEKAQTTFWGGPSHTWPAVCPGPSV